MIEQRTFNNRYRLDHALGEGGMARVYLGVDTLLRRRVAIKVLREQYAADEEFVRRFYQEAESAAKLSHPNIVNTYDVGREGDLYYIVMELVDGPSLAEILAADAKLPEPVAIDYMVQVCTGLAYAHRQGLLHRDIKPANILVTKDDVVKLSDFGIARAITQHTMALTTPGLVMGSIFYISPEQAQGHDLHEASDLYSVGVVLYQMLTGSLPYTGESPVAVALKHIGDPVPTIDTAKYGVSPALAAIVNRLLQKAPEHRFGSASEVASALREARERPSVAAYRIEDDAPGNVAALNLPPRRSKMPDRPEREQNRRTSGANVAILVIALLAAMAIGFWIFGRPLPDFGATLTVGNYVGETDAQAEQDAANAGLSTKIFHSSSDTVPLAHVIRQNPVPGTKVAHNAVVELFISNGLPTLGLRDVRGFSGSDAQRILEDDKFRVRILQRYDSATKGSVVDQRPTPGSRVQEGSTITLIVSEGPAPLTLPNFVGMTIDQAQTQAEHLGVLLDANQQVAVPGEEANTVASQDPAAGSKIARGSVVHVAVNTFAAGADSQIQGGTVIPDVVGDTYAGAIAQLQQAGFSVSVEFSVQSSGNGTVIGEQPQAGAQAPSDSRVGITLSVPGEVPDTDGLTVDQARAALEAAGYSIASMRYTATEGAGGRVIGTDPIAGTNLAPGSGVVLVVNGAAP